MELNPNHKTTRAVSEHWHKVVALIMHKLQLRHIVITAANIEAMSKQEVAIAIDDRPDGLHVSLVDINQAEMMAKKEGGLPV